MMLEPNFTIKNYNPENELKHLLNELKHLLNEVSIE